MLSKERRSFVAERMKAPSPSSTISLADKAQAMKQKGIELFDLTVGQPHFDTPEKVKESAKKALDSGLTHYTQSSGIPELITALKDKLERENRVVVDNGEILVTVGAKEAVFDAVFCTVNEGDEVLVPDPYWNTYWECVKLAGGVPIPIPLGEDNSKGRFYFDTEKLKHALSPRTKMIMLNSPHNPTGMVLQKGELQTIADLCVENDLLALSDEIYEKIIFDGSKHYSIGSFEGMGERTITVNGFSKAYAMTGWRLGYAAGPKEIIDKMKILHQHTVTHPASFAQKAAIVALTDCSDEIEAMRKQYQDLRDFFVDSLGEVGDLLEVIKPEGTFYAFPRIVGETSSSKQMADTLLERARILCVPGSSFGANGESHLRFVFAQKRETLEKIAENIRTLA